MGHARVGWGGVRLGVMQGWGGVGHARVGWVGSCKDGVGCVM